MAPQASLKAKYEPSFSSSQRQAAASATLTLGFGEDLKLKASCTDRTFNNNSNDSLTGLSLGIEKPGLFIIDYDVPKQAARFQFMNSAKVYGKQLKLTYIHPQKANATLLETTLVLDPANKLSGKYSLDSGKGSLKYSYAHTSGVTFEPAYDFTSDAWSFAASRKLGSENTLKAAYETSNKVLDLEWTKESKETGSFKVVCSVSPNEKKVPKLTFERTWDLEI